MSQRLPLVAMHLDPPARGKRLVGKDGANTGLLDGVDVIVLGAIALEGGGHKSPHLNGTYARAMGNSQTKKGPVSGA